MSVVSTIGNHTWHHCFCWDILLLQSYEEALTMLVYLTTTAQEMPAKYKVKTLLFQKFAIAARRKSHVKFDQVGSTVTSSELNVPSNEQPFC
jgi:hypothetical protein